MPTDLRLHALNPKAHYPAHTYLRAIAAERQLLACIGAARQVCADLSRLVKELADRAPARRTPFLAPPRTSAGLLCAELFPLPVIEAPVSSGDECDAECAGGWTHLFAYCT